MFQLHLFSLSILFAAFISTFEQWFSSKPLQLVGYVIQPPFYPAVHVDIKLLHYSLVLKSVSLASLHKASLQLPVPLIIFQKHFFPVLKI